MKTRSQSKLESMALYEVDINFDEASEAWKANKRSIGNGSYKYVCVKRGKKNNYCICKCLPGEDYCKRHFKMIIEEK